jgi:hypothetical protein
LDRTSRTETWRISLPEPGPKGQALLDAPLRSIGQRLD